MAGHHIVSHRIKGHQKIYAARQSESEVETVLDPLCNMLQSFKIRELGQGQTGMMGKLS